MNIAENLERIARFFPINVAVIEDGRGVKVPKEFVLVDDLPKSNAGKLLKRKIKAHYTSKCSQ